MPSCSRRGRTGWPPRLRLDGAWYTRDRLLLSPDAHTSGRSPPFRPCAPSAWHRSKSNDSGGHMPLQSRAQSLRFVALAAGALTLTPASPRLAAQTQTHTRQVSVETLIYDLKSPDAL